MFFGDQSLIKIRDLFFGEFIGIVHPHTYKFLVELCGNKGVKLFEKHHKFIFFFDENNPSEHRKIIHNSDEAITLNS